MLRVAAATIVVALYGMLGLAVLVGGDSSAGHAGSGLNVDALPPAAAAHVDDVVAAAADCPQMPLPRLAAHITVESGWNPTAYNASSGASGLVQFMPDTWINHGPGRPWAGRPPAGHPVFDPTQHLPAAMSLFCANYSAMEAHLALSGKPVSLLDAVAVCHVAGCSRVTNSASGIPTAGDIAATGCQAACVATVADYLDQINEFAAAYTAADGGVPVIPVDGLPPPPLPYPGGSAGCTIPDGTGCITPVTAWMRTQVSDSAGGTWPGGIGCYGARPTNPTSDHPPGRACDLTIGHIGDFPTDAERDVGWVYAEWLRAYAVPLRIKYLVWDGKVWDSRRADEGWRTYDPGDAYDVRTPTGGHYDHIHVSVT